MTCTWSWGLIDATGVSFRWISPPILTAASTNGFYFSQKHEEMSILLMIQTALSLLDLCSPSPLPLHNANWDFARFDSSGCSRITAVSTVFPLACQLWCRSSGGSSKEARLSQRLPQARWRQLGNTASQQAPLLGTTHRTHRHTWREKNNTGGLANMQLTQRAQADTSLTALWHVEVSLSVFSTSHEAQQDNWITLIYCYGGSLDESHWEIIWENCPMIYMICGNNTISWILNVFCPLPSSL